MKTVNDDSNAPLDERQSVDALMPWYVAGTLSPVDASRVDAALAADPSLGASLDAAFAEMADVRADNETRPRPQADGLSALMARIEAESPRPATRVSRAKLIDMLGNLISSLSPRAMGYAVVAAALVIALQAGLAVRLWTRASDQMHYETASAPVVNRSSDGSLAVVHFANGVPLDAVVQFLRENDLSIIEGPKAGGIFRVRIAPTPMTGEALKQRIAGLAARSDIISSIVPVP